MADPTSESLVRERARATFVASELTVLLNGARATEFKKEVSPILRADKVLQELRDREPFNSKQQRMEDMLPKTLRFKRLIEEHWPQFDGLPSLAQAAGFQYDYAFPPFDGTLLSPYNGMFTSLIRTQCDESQRARWEADAMAGRIWGTYAQTEIGHGSNVRGLETTATYDPATQEFEVHSPSLSAAKWWPAHLGFGCTHAAVYARIITPGGVDNGVLPLIVPLRDPSTMRPLPGITLGTSGPTIGHYANEHGRCRFDRVRVPRDHLPMRWSQVTPDGKFVRAEQKAAKVSYISMTQTRVMFVSLSHRALAKSLTIAVRYSLQRRQGFRGDSEPLVLDYGQQRRELISALAVCYALKFASLHVEVVTKAAMRIVEATNTTPEERDNVLAQMPDLHATTSGLKAISTQLSVDGSAVARRACGGHGYGVFSGLPQLYLNSLRSLTVEGDNTVLCLQVARSLVAACAGNSNRGGSDMAYLASSVRSGAETGQPPQRCSVRSSSDWADPSQQLCALEFWAATTVHKAAAAYERDVASGLSQGDAWEKRMVVLVRAAVVHSKFSLAKFFQAAVDELEGVSSQLRAVLQQLSSLFAMTQLQENLGALGVTGYITDVQADALEDAIADSVDALRPDALALVDAFDFDDVLELYQTAIGRYDGCYPERLWEWSEKDPVNRGDGTEASGAVPPGNFEDGWRALREMYGAPTAAKL